LWGAGPGAPDLITLRGYRLIAGADLIIYAGSLVNPALLEGAKAGCVIHDSASMNAGAGGLPAGGLSRPGRAGCAPHTGDPSLYGAIREQMDALDCQRDSLRGDAGGQLLLRGGGRC
jgi:precorrin-4/cobalt-precorrin-4 C11-methyltransferase